MLNLSLFWVLEEVHERPVTLTLMKRSWLDRRLKPYLFFYFAVGCSGREWIGPIILAYLRHR